MQKIALEKTAHSWLLPLMKLPAWRIEEAEVKLDKWIDQQTEDEDVAFLLKKSIALYLEWEAVDSYVMQHQSLAGALPVVTTPMEAMELINMDWNGMFKQPQMEQAARLLEEMKAGTRKPAVRTLMRSATN